MGRHNENVYSSVRLMIMFLIILIAVLSIAMVPYANASVPSDGLLAEYQFTGNADDTSGNGNHGTVYGALLAEDRFGNPDAAFIFNGIDDYIYISDSVSLNPADEITISTWVNLNAYKATLQNILAKDDFDNLYRDYLLYIGHGVNNDQATFVAFPEGTLSFTADQIPTGGNLALGQWHHVVGVYNGSTMETYLDGQLVGSKPLSGTLHDSDTPLLIGHTNDSRYDRAFDGLIDDIRIYDHALSDAEIMDLYNEGGWPLTPDISVADSYLPADDHQIAFGGERVLTTSEYETLTVENQGNASLQLNEIILMGRNPEDYIIDVDYGSTPCSLGEVAAGDSCTIGVTFSPLNEGIKIAIVRITSDDPDEPTVNVYLTGTGLPENPNNPPPVPKLILPINGKSDLETTVDFSWGQGEDPDGNVLKHYLYVSEDQDFTGTIPVEIADAESYHASAGFGLAFLMFGLALAGGIGRRRKLALILILLIAIGLSVVSCSGSDSSNSSTRLIEYKVSMSDMNPATEYYWKVVADDGEGAVIESPIWHFSTK